MLKLLNRFRSARPDESGQALVIAVLAAFLLLIVAGYAIDFAAANAKQEQVQNATDAAALAAANCLANAGITGPCTSTTDTSDAANAAVTIAQANGLKLTSTQVSINTTSDQVSIQGSSSMAGLTPFGSDSRAKVENAQATAAYTPPTNVGVTGSTKVPEQCLNGDVGSGNCIAIFAGGNPTGGSSCPGWWLYPGNYFNYAYGLNGFGYGVSDGASILGIPILSYGDTIDGAIVSNGNVDFESAFGSTGYIYYGSNSNCWPHVDWFSGSGPQIKLSSNQDYPQKWSASTVAGTETLTSNSGQTLPCTVTVTPSTPNSITTQNGVTTTILGGNIIFTAASILPGSNPQIPSGVYCDPTGSITFAGLSFLGTLTGDISLYANSISGFNTILSATNLCPYGSTTCPWPSSGGASALPSNRLLMYQSGGGELSLNDSWTSFSGTIYAPNAEIGVNQIATSVGFLEGATVALAGIDGYYGAGPEISTSSGAVVTTTQTPTPGTDSLSG